MAVTKILFDTSVLVPVMVATHEHHAIAAHWLGRAIAKEFRLVVAAHSLAECYATLTRLPAPHRIAPDRVITLLRTNIIERARAVTISLESTDVVDVLEGAASRGTLGGQIYDALIVRAAMKAKARILTFNAKHFRRLCDDPEHDLLEP